MSSVTTPLFLRARLRWTGRDLIELVCSTCGDTHKFPVGFDDETEQGSKLLFLMERGRRRFHKQLKEGPCMADVRDYATKLAKLPDRIAAIVGKTYAENGDSATIADDEALMRIRDLLVELDPTLIQRNKNKKLAPR